MIKPQDFPKIESPFVRKLNENNEYLVTPEITPGYEWVFSDESVLAIEKLHGTNVSIIVENGTIVSVWNRTERIPFFNKGKWFIIEAVQESNLRSYCDLPDGQWWGEVVGPKLQGNPYKLDKHVWIPFATFGQKHLKYKSWGKYPKDFETISMWFQDLMPLYYTMKHGMSKDANGKYVGFVEGVVFTHPDGRMAKLRKDMFSWHSGKCHKGIEKDNTEEIL